MKKNLNRTVALALAVMLVVCFPFAVSGEEAAAEIPVQTEEVIEVSETVEPAVEENVPQPVSVWIITLNLGSTEYYYDDLMLGANIENATAAGIRWQICKSYDRDGANDWKDYKYDEVIHVTVEPGIENWAFRCILPSGDMSQEFVVTKNFGYRPAEEEITEETILEESTETIEATEEVVVETEVTEEVIAETEVTEEVIAETEETEEVVAETEVTEEVVVETEAAEDDFVEFEDDELAEFDDDDWGTTEGSDFSELDNLANGVEENAAEAETEEVAEETEIEEVTEEAEAETPAAEAEEITDVVVEEEKEEAKEEIEEVTEEVEAETPAVEAEEITDVVVEEEKEEAKEEIEEVTEEVTEEAEAETPVVEADEIADVVVEEENNEEIEEVTEEAETETPVAEAEAVTEEKQTEVENAEIVESIPEAVEVIEGTVTELPAVEGEETSEVIVIEDESSSEFDEQIEAQIEEIAEPYVDIEVYWEGDDLYFGDTITLIAHAYNVEGLEYDILWQSSKDDATWCDEGYGDSISYIVTKANQWDYWQAVIVLK